jgi:hypothetical protein
MAEHKKMQQTKRRIQRAKEEAEDNEMTQRGKELIEKARNITGEGTEDSKLSAIIDILADQYSK